MYDCMTLDMTTCMTVITLPSSVMYDSWQDYSHVNFVADS